MNRALGPAHIDLIRDGIPPHALKARGDKAKWDALVRTAAAANQRGWDAMEWAALITDARSHLGTQLKLKNGRTILKPLDVQRLLADAWDHAHVWLSEHPPAYDKATAAANAAARATQALTHAADPDRPLTDSARAVLAHLAHLARDYGSDTVTCPRRDLQAATGLNLTALRTAIDVLVHAGAIEVVERGRPRGAAARAPARAARYRLPLNQYPETGLVVPPRVVSGAPPPDAPGAPPVVSGAPHPAGTHIDFTALHEETEEQAIARFRKARRYALTHRDDNVIDLRDAITARRAR